MNPPGNGRGPHPAVRYWQWYMTTSATAKPRKPSS